MRFILIVPLISALYLGKKTGEALFPLSSILIPLVVVGIAISFILYVRYCKKANDHPYLDTDKIGLLISATLSSFIFGLLIFATTEYGVRDQFPNTTTLEFILSFLGSGICATTLLGSSILLLAKPKKNNTPTQN